MGRVWAGKLTGRGIGGQRRNSPIGCSGSNPEAFTQLLVPGAASGTRTGQPRYGELRSLSLILHIRRVAVADQQLYLSNK